MAIKLVGRVAIVALVLLSLAPFAAQAADQSDQPRESYGPAPASCFYYPVGPTGRSIIAYLFNPDGSPRYAIADATIRVRAVLEDGTRYSMSRPIYSNQPPAPPPNQHMEILVARVPSDQFTAITKCSAWVLPPEVPGRIEP